MDKFEVKKWVKKTMNDKMGGEWRKLTDDKKERMIKDLTEIFYEKINRTEEGVERDLKVIKDRTREAIFFFFGIVFGIVGGLVATIIHSFLSPYGCIYYLLVFLFFFVIMIIFVNFVRDETSRIYQSNEILVKLGKRAEEIIKEKQDKKSK